MFTYWPGTAQPLGGLFLRQQRGPAAGATAGAQRESDRGAVWRGQTRRQVVRLCLALWLVVGFAFWAGPRAHAQQNGVYVVTTNTDGHPSNTVDGQCSLREAVAAINTQSQVDSCPPGVSGANASNNIAFQVNGGSSLQTIILTHGPLTITQSVDIQGGTQRCGKRPCIELKGSALATSGLILQGAESTVSGLVLNSFNGAALHMTGAGESTVIDNFIGTDFSGAQSSKGNGIGILATPPQDATIHIGLSSGRNIIAGNERGLVIQGSGGVVRVCNNHIGTGVTGAEFLGNSSDGIHIQDSANHQIGDIFSDLCPPNLIVNNFVGLRISGSASTGNKVYNSLFGTDATYTKSRGNTTGIRIEAGAQKNLIGGEESNMGNVIGNGVTGIAITGLDTSGNLVRNNSIGVSPDGTTALPLDIGVLITGRASGNVIGRLADTHSANQVAASQTGPGNTIGHSGTGIYISENGTRENRVAGNRIGVGPNDTPIGNGSGIQIVDGGTVNVIGGIRANDGNIIGFNGAGIVINGIASVNNQIYRNGIGTDLAGSKNLGNGLDGIRISEGASRTQVGSVASSLGNVIAYNQGAGVLVAGGGTRNGIQGNRIFANGQLGIDLSQEPRTADGVTPNDVQDLDGSSNGLQNYPILGLALDLEGFSTAAFTFNAKPNTTYRFEFFANSSPDASGHGEGAQYLGFEDVVTDFSGNLSFVKLLNGVAGNLIAITATDPDGNTSEFSGAAELVSIRTCFFVGLLAEGELGADWHTGQNWACDQTATLLPNDSTRTVIGDNQNVTDQQFALVQPSNEASAGQVQINPASGLTVQGNLNATLVENNGLFSVPGTATVNLGLTNQAGSTLQLGDATGVSGTTTVVGEAMLAGVLQGEGTLNLSQAQPTFSGLISPGFGDLGALTAVAHTAGNRPLTRTVPAILTILGDTNLISATLAVDLFGGDSSDQLVIDGRGQVGGRLRLQMRDPVPSVARAAAAPATMRETTYTILTCSQGCNGAFAAVEAPDGYAADDVQVVVEANAVRVILRGEPGYTLALPAIWAP